MEYVYLVVSIIAILIITNSAQKKINELQRIIKLKEGIIKEKSKHEKCQQEVIDELVKENRQLRLQKKKSLEEWKRCTLKIE